MIKTITIARKKPGMTDAEFSHYWKDIHGPLAAKGIPGVRRYVQNHVISVPGHDSDVNGVVEMWYDDLPTFQKSMAFLMSPAGKFLRDDGSKFCGAGKPGEDWVVEEYVIKDELTKK